MLVITLLPGMRLCAGAIVDIRYVFVANTRPVVATGVEHVVTRTEVAGTDVAGRTEATTKVGTDTRIVHVYIF